MTSDKILLFDKAFELYRKSDFDGALNVFDAYQTLLHSSSAPPAVIVATNPETPPGVQPPLTSDQQQAWVKIQNWLRSDHSIFVLKGYAGTGKSFLMKMLLSLPYNFVFSAPTNKASKVLSDFLDQPVKTTYSVLGLRMTAEDDQLVLTAHPMPDLGTKPLLVIDECGMVPKFMADMLRQACAERGWRIIFVGDPAQLNPIGESRSVVWGMAHPEHRAMLREVKRFDNELLALSIKIRTKIKDRDYRIRIRDDNSAGEGVFVRKSRYEMLQQIKSLTLNDWDTTKITAWRNRTVDGYNQMIRRNLGFTAQYCVDDRILMGAPLISDGQLIAHTDEELKIVSVDDRVFSVPEGDIKAYAISVADRSFGLYVPQDPGVLQTILSKRANLASAATGIGRKKEWARFWELKNMFQSIRYGYALTTHRLQGSTLDNIFVDQTDILANPNKRESFRSLYVAATRPRLSLTTY